MPVAVPQVLVVQPRCDSRALRSAAPTCRLVQGDRRQLFYCDCLVFDGFIQRIRIARPKAAHTLRVCGIELALGGPAIAGGRSALTLEISRTRTTSREPSARRPTHMPDVLDLRVSSRLSSSCNDRSVAQRHPLLGVAGRAIWGLTCEHVLCSANIPSDFSGRARRINYDSGSRAAAARYKSARVSRGMLPHADSLALVDCVADYCPVTD